MQTRAGDNDPCRHVITKEIPVYCVDGIPVPDVGKMNTALDDIVNCQDIFQTPVVHIIYSEENKVKFIYNNIIERWISIGYKKDRYLTKAMAIFIRKAQEVLGLDKETAKL